MTWNLLSLKFAATKLELVIDEKLRADTSAAEATGTDKLIDFLSNGFKIRTDDAEFNTSDADYLFYAIAENPFVTSGGVPATAY